MQFASEQHVLRVNFVIDFGYSLALAKPNKMKLSIENNTGFITLVPCLKCLIHHPISDLFVNMHLFDECSFQVETMVAKFQCSEIQFYLLTRLRRALQP